MSAATVVERPEEPKQSRLKSSLDSITTVTRMLVTGKYIELNHYTIHSTYRHIHSLNRHIFSLEHPAYTKRTLGPEIPRLVSMKWIRVIKAKVMSTKLKSK